MHKAMMATIGLMALAACSSGGEEGAPEEDVATADATDAVSAEALTSEGWGPLRIGMNRDEVTAAVGGKADPEALGGPEPEYCEEYQPAQTPEGLYVMIEEGVLTRITLFENDEIETSEGLSVGATAEEVRVAYGDRIRSRPHTYVEAPGEYLTVWTNGEVDENGTSDENARGIRYVISEDRLVQSIHAGGPSIQYVEGCL